VPVRAFTFPRFSRDRLPSRCALRCCYAHVVTRCYACTRWRCVPRVARFAFWVHTTAFTVRYVAGTLQCCVSAALLIVVLCLRYASCARACCIRTRCVVESLPRSRYVAGTLIGVFTFGCGTIVTRSLPLFFLRCDRCLRCRCALFAARCVVRADVYRCSLHWVPLHYIRLRCRQYLLLPLRVAGDYVPLTFHHCYCSIRLIVADRCLLPDRFADRYGYMEHVVAVAHRCYRSFCCVTRYAARYRVTVATCHILLPCLL